MDIVLKTNCPAKDIPEKEAEILRRGVGEFAFVLKAESTTFNDFANDIEAAYDKDVPYIAEICRIFRKYSL